MIKFLCQQFLAIIESDSYAYNASYKLGSESTFFSYTPYMQGLRDTVKANLHQIVIATLIDHIASFDCILQMAKQIAAFCRQFFVALLS